MMAKDESAVTKSRCAVTICRNGIIYLDPRYGGGTVFCSSCKAAMSKGERP